MGLDLHPARPSVTEKEWEDYGSWYREPGGPHPQWSYGGFARFRERLAEHEGFDLDAMKGFGGERDWSDVTTDLKPLLNHSDCDGELTPAECARVFPRLEQVIDKWRQRDCGEFDYDVRSGGALVAAMKKCATENLTLIFR